MKHIGGLLRRVLRETRVVDPKLEDAVLSVAREYWPEATAEVVRIGDFKRGVLHLVLDSHARVAEAKGFIGDAFRSAVNQRLEQNDRDYVSKLVFHVSGTF